MPELPEVEVTRRSFAERVRGARIEAVRLGKPLRWPLGIEPEALVGRRIGAVERRGKYLWVPLEAGGSPLAAGTGSSPAPVGSGGLLMHLGMSGSLRFQSAAEAVGEPGPHDHFDLVTADGTLRLTDPRRFGAVVWSPARDADPAAKLLAGLGLEPFDAAFDGAHLHAALRGRRVSIKQALLGGAIVVGAGNIYASEALFEAGIDPRTRGDRLSRPRCARLAEAVRGTLTRALELGGSTLRNFTDAHGMAGRFQQQAWVYGREGEPCRVCGIAICRIVQGQRATFYCPTCQRR